MPTERPGGTALLRRLPVLLGLCWAALCQGQTIESVLAPGPLVQGHAKVEEDCAACHSRFDRSGQDRLCLVCHKDVGSDLRQHRGFHGRRDSQPACRSCHADHKGRDARIAAFDTRNFDHRGTDFQLLDKHVSVPCAKCHASGKRWREAPATCIACHARDDVHKGGLGPKCEDCHGARSWKDTAFDHDRQTHFALSGKHAAARCDSCHAQGRFKDTPRSCIGCHRKDDAHKGQFSEKCEACHDAKAWKPSTFNHDVDTHYALRERHRMVKCTACHTGALYQQKLGTACVDCHLKDDKHEGTLGRQCAGCHSERGWKDAPGFDHDRSRFPLHGAHVRAQCTDCHKDILYRQTPGRCIDCHRKDDRHQATLGETCADCHTEERWNVTRFDHQRTKFPLRNAHAARSVKCQDCHETLRAYRRTPTSCDACHERDDRHAGTLGPRCDDCHTDSRWRIERYDHARTRFPLLGRHQVVNCDACHRSQRYREAARDCLACHQRDDRHKATLGADCARCHNARAWSLWAFDHDKATNYRLEGRHRTTACAACHVAPAPVDRAVAALGSDCASCHRQDDAHEGRFGRRCDTCHTPDDWRRVRPATVPRAASAASS